MIGSATGLAHRTLAALYALGLDIFILYRPARIVAHAF